MSFSFLEKCREWDGMVRELLEQRADLAIADLTITFDREQVQIIPLAREDAEEYIADINLVSIQFPGGGLHDALYESGNINFVPQANETAAKFVLILISIVSGRLDLHGDSLSRSFRSPVHSSQVNFGNSIMGESHFL